MPFSSKANDERIIINDKRIDKLSTINVKRKVINILKKSLGFRESVIYMLIEPVVGYTRIVSATKMFLSILALILIVILIILPFQKSINKNYKITFSQIDASEEGKLPAMINPTFTGIDSKGQNYKISAKKATNEDNKVIYISYLNAELNLSDNNWASVTSNNGIYKPEANTLDLLENVNLFTKDGYEFQSEGIFVDFKAGKAFGDSKITGQGDIGTIEADSFVIEEQGNYIFLNGNVKLIIYPGLIN